MRFLLFNVTVTAALIYLFTVDGTGDQTSVKKKAENLFTTAKTTVGAVMDKVPGISKEGTTITAIAAEIAKAPARKVATDRATAAAAPHRDTSIKPVASDQPKGPTVLAVVAKDELGDTQPPPLPSAVEVEPVRARPALAISQEPETENVAEGVPYASTDPVTPSQETPRFMTPRERRRELQRLARDMEDMFVHRLGP